jgi:hypothetical protein
MCLTPRCSRLASAVLRRAAERDRWAATFAQSFTPEGGWHVGTILENHATNQTGCVDGRAYRRNANLDFHWVIVFKFPLRFSPSRSDHSGGCCRETIFSAPNVCWNGRWNFGLHRRPLGHFQAKGEFPLGLCIYRNWRTPNIVSFWRTGIPPLRKCLTRRPLNAACAAICFWWSGFAIVESRSWRKPRCLSSRALGVSLKLE